MSVSCADLRLSWTLVFVSALVVSMMPGLEGPVPLEECPGLAVFLGGLRRALCSIMFLVGFLRALANDAMSSVALCVYYVVSLRGASASSALVNVEVVANYVFCALPSQQPQATHWPHAVLLVVIFSSAMDTRCLLGSGSSLVFFL